MLDRYSRSYIVRRVHLQKDEYHVMCHTSPVDSVRDVGAQMEAYEEVYHSLNVQHYRLGFAL